MQLTGRWLGCVLLLIVAIVNAAGQSTPPKLRSGKFSISEEDRRYWAFQRVEKPPVPTGRAAGASGHPVDRFLSIKLSEAGLSLSPLATPREQVRRVYFDLLGLPPSPEDVAEFERDPSDRAWTNLVQHLLASPHYGQRWGRHWLDLVRYAESNGYERDGPKPNAWRYRDYVIDAFNQDKPYDQFIREQLAGDELMEEQTAHGVTTTPAWRAAIVATGFFRLHVWDDEPDSTIKAEFDDLDDIMVTTGTAFLGLTIGCARCHDHKFDPFSQADYYSMLSFIRSIDPYGQHHTGGGGRGTGRIERPLATSAEIQAWEEQQRRRREPLEQRLAQTTNAEVRKKIEMDLKKVREAAAPFDQALAIAETGSLPKPTHILARGDAFTPKEEVQPAFPAVFGLTSPILPSRPAQAVTTGRRRVLAEWVASPDNPLTARVMVNRIWQKHFGTGLVPSVDDFGRTGLPPTHPFLLDYLASEFVARGWSIKQMHHLILTSLAYRMSSQASNARARQRDEGNTLYWRQNLRRVEAETARDTMLAVSGALNPKMGGPSVFPTLPKEVHGTQDSSGKGWTDSPTEEQNRRSVYLVVKRALKVPLLECLDFANSASPTGARPITTTAPQALMLLNDGFVQARAADLAERIRRERGPDIDAQIARAFQLVLQRSPQRAERTAARRLLIDQELQAKADGVTDPNRAAWQSLCRGLLNLNETIYVE